MVHTGLRWSQAKVDQAKNRKKNDYRPIDINSRTSYTLIANFYLFFGWLEQREDGKSNARFTASTATESAGQQNAARLLLDAEMQKSDPYFRGIHKGDQK